MHEATLFGIAMIALGQIALSVTILVMRAVRTPAYLPLAGCLVAIGVIILGPTVALYAPSLEAAFIIMTLPALLMLGPTLWFYIEGLTSETLWRFEARHARHLVPFALGLIVMLLLMALPEHEKQTMFIEGNEPDRLYPALIIILGLFLIIGWMGQSGFYLWRTFRRLSRYRRRLKDVFSSTENRELGWIGILFAVLTCSWAISVAYILLGTFVSVQRVNPIIGMSMSLMIVWLLSAWGLRQKPGFEGAYADNAVSASKPADMPEKKYQRSALTDEQAQRIVRKIDDALDNDRLYLDPNLSLQKLSKHIGVTPNYISQTLNETLQSSFFDRVNARRVAHAKRLIGENAGSILQISIEVGFNARSSFYKAFKRETGMTPSEYRETLKTKADKDNIATNDPMNGTAHIDCTNSN